MPFFAEHRDRLVEHVAAMLGNDLANNLAHSNDHRFEEPPPPYTSSPESTRPHSPAVEPKNVDEVESIRLSMEARYKGTPASMFDILTRQEMGRIIHQISASPSGRPQTLHYDENLDIRQNGENNVREYCITDEIWEDDWGQAWSSGHSPLNKRQTQGQQNEPPRPMPRGHWGHERIATIDINRASGAGDISSPRLRQGDAELGFNVGLQWTRASRPDHQFNNQLLREKCWIRDERAWTSRQGLRGCEASDTDDRDLESAAYEDLEEFWRINGLWPLHWGRTPGILWAHELPDDSLERRSQYRQLYDLAVVSAPAPAVRYGSRSCWRPTHSGTTLGIFDPKAVPAPAEQAILPTAGRRQRKPQQGQQSADLRRSPRIKAREAKVVRRSVRLHQRRQQQQMRVPRHRTYQQD